MELNRRSFIASAALVAAGATSVAVADEAPATFADTIEWAAEYDVVVIGMGFAGLSSSMCAADAGAAVLMLEKTPAAIAGGNSRVCGQCFSWGADNEEDTYAYYKAMCGSRYVPEAVLRTLTTNVAHMGDVLAGFGMNPDDYTPSGFAAKPEYPEFPGSESVTIWTTHPGVSDSYLYQSMRTRLLENYSDKVDVWFEAPAVELIQDPVTKTIVGVVVERGGQVKNVRALNGVVMACGGFEANADMVQHYLNLINYAPSGSLYNTGDGIRMASAAGARMWHMTAWEGMGSPAGTAFDTEPGTTAVGSTITTSGSSIAVGGWGERFIDETVPGRHAHYLASNGLWENVHYPERMFLVWDQAKNDELEEAGKVKDEFRHTITACANLAEAAEVIGCTAEQLQATIDDFNYYCEVGRDFHFGRNPETMRAFEGDALYVMSLRARMLNTQGGAERNENAEVLDYDGNPIPHLYSAGEFGGSTCLMYHAGTNVDECFIIGKIAGTNAAAPKEPLPAYEAAQAVVSNPTRLGEDTDLEAPAAVEVGEGELVGSAKGMGGDVTVVVTLDESGAIASVVALENFETPGIGSKAIDQVPERFVGLSTAEEIDAVDGVAGATVTTKALRAAVKQAMGF